MASPTRSHGGAARPTDRNTCVILCEAREASPAELRVAVRPSESGASIEILKRRAPRFIGSIEVQLRTDEMLSVSGVWRAAG
jgi:hypothetical protein